MISRDVCTGNLPSSTAERDIEEEFIRFGTLRSVWVARKPPGFGEGLSQNLFCTLCVALACQVLVEDCFSLHVC